MEINRFNVVLGKFQQFCFDLKVLKKLDPTVARVAGACHGESQQILQISQLNG